MIPTARRWRHVTCATRERANMQRRRARSEGFDAASYHRLKSGHYRVYAYWSKKKQKMVKEAER